MDSKRGQPENPSAGRFARKPRGLAIVRPISALVESHGGGCRRSKRDRDSSQLHTEAGVPRGVGPRSSGCSHNQSTPLSCATVTI